MLLAKCTEMTDVKEFVTKLFKTNHLTIAAGKTAALDAFVTKEKNAAVINAIIQHTNELMANWKLEERVTEIVQQPVRVVNGAVGKPYETTFDFDKLQWSDIADFTFVGLSDIGLAYDAERKQITGTPTQSGDFNIIFQFRLNGESEETPVHQKTMLFIINPDPKSLWKSIDSDQTDPYRKDDNVTQFATLGDRYILVSSRRGRSHANIGSFREDDFAFAELPGGWSLVVVADGAGSAKLSRKGSAIACQSVVNYFSDETVASNLQEFDALLDEQDNKAGAEAQKKITHFVYHFLGKGVVKVHNTLQEFAKEARIALKDLSSTLIFTLFKKYNTGYAFLSFGVGDCPIAVVNKDVSEVTLLNWLDVGEFGGGTRFITMPEIFKSEKFSTRFSYKFTDSFSYLFLMSDGIYDPKFVVEANLSNIKKWQEFLADLAGNNEDGVAVTLDPDNQQITEQFSKWMDFWSAGNHDDRTLAIVF